MNLGSYRLLAQLSAGSDGVSYRAQDETDGTPAEVRVLSAARTDPAHWARLVKRLRLTALLDHPGAVAIPGLHLEHEPPYVALEAVERKTLAEVLHDRLPLPIPEALALVRDLASVLVAAHRVGLAHGRLGPRRILCPDYPRLRIDFTDLEVESSSEPVAPVKSDASADICALGAMLAWMLTGQSLEATMTLPADAEPVSALVREMLTADPSERPTALQVEQRIRALLPSEAPVGSEAPSGSLLSATIGAPPVPAAPSLEQRGRERLQEQLHRDAPRNEEPAIPDRLGRFRILERLGQGGMGTVYRAEDVTDGAVVAIKVLRADLAARAGALQRFYKEARILAEVNNPCVVNLLEINQDNGIHYLVMEFVEGQNLGDLLAERKRLDEPTALAILADVARGLADAHERGIVHRDIKPENILLRRRTGDPGTFDVKLSDFGLARHVIESESLNVTQAGAIMGTPLYMAPEQGSGGTVDPRTDVYSLGATLFHLLAGRPPFTAPSPMALLAAHCNEPPPSLRQLNSDLSESVCGLVERMLAKPPDARPASAADVLRDVERMLRGEPIDLAVHPRLPAGDPAAVVRYEFVWELNATPRQLWPYVSNTERLNQAAGLPGVQFTAQVEDETPDDELPPRVRRFGGFRWAGVGVNWEEHPFEWIEGRRMGVLRQYSQGPFKWLVSVVELTPRPGGGTTLLHQVRLEPHNLLGRTMAAVEVGLRGRRSLDRVYRRIDAFVTGKLGTAAGTDPFEDPPSLSGAQRRRLETLLDRLGESGLDPAVIERFGAFLAHAPAQAVARIRPLALARRLGLDPEAVVAACLHGAREGLLVLLWDILCPICRIPSEIKDSMRALRDHGSCTACNLDFELDFANSVEMIFRIHPEVRTSDLATYCIGGPAHSPHIVAQVRVAPGERLELELALGEGSYRVCGPQLPYVLGFRVEGASSRVGSALPHRWDLVLPHPPRSDLPTTLRAGRQVLELTNQHGQELVVRVERTTGREDTLTAARASTLGLFRELFPGEVLAPGQLISVSTVTLLVTALDQSGNLYEDLGDARAFAMLHEQFRLLSDCIRREGGALVKTVGEGIVAAFSDPVDAVRAGLELHALLASEPVTRDLRLRVGVHRGSAMAATINDHLDYFGSTVSQAGELLQWVRGGEIVLTQSVAADPKVATLLRGRGLEGEVIDRQGGGRSAMVGLRIACAIPR